MIILRDKIGLVSEVFQNTVLNKLTEVIHDIYHEATFSTFTVREKKIVSFKAKNGNTSKGYHKQNVGGLIFGNHYGFITDLVRNNRSLLSFFI